MRIFPTRVRRASTATSSPSLLIMLKVTPPWRCSTLGKIKFLAVFIVCLVTVNYLFGAQAYHVDYNVIQYYMDGGVSRSPPSDDRPPSGGLPRDPGLQRLDPTASLISAAVSDVNASSLEQGSSAVLGVARAGVTNASGVIVSGNATTTARLMAGSLAPVPKSDLMQGQPANLSLCPMVPPVLVGPIRVWFDYPSFAELQALYPFLTAGGHSTPSTCRSRHRVAVIIPYRDRERHLRGFLHNMHSLLTKQQLDYAIFVVEQVANQTFNRAKLMNVGFAEASRLYDWQCFVFHDVDLLPEDDRNLYTCPEQPRHMSVAVDKFKYKLPYGDLFGGISAITRQQFLTMNGFSNDYWGWGGEDDDMATRVKLSNFRISRYPANIARYKMIKHGTDKRNTVNKCRHTLMYKTKQRYKTDGVSSLQYRLVQRTLEPTYTHLVVDLLEEQSRQHLSTFVKCG